MRFLLNGASSINGSSETAVFESKPMSSETVNAINHIVTKITVGAVCIVAINATGWVAVAVIGTVAFFKIVTEFCK